MNKEFAEVSNLEFIKGVEETFVNYRQGKKVKGAVIVADASGVSVRIGGKHDGLIKKEDAEYDREYDPANYPVNLPIEAIIISQVKDRDTGRILLSKKLVDSARAGDKFVDSIRDGHIFEMVMESEIKGGLLSKVGSYNVFVPQSQIRESFVKELKQFVGKKLRLVAIEIDDVKLRIIASQRKVLEFERKEKEDLFWTHVLPDTVVSGKVKRFVEYGAFVSVGGLDCLAHMSDLSYKKISAPSDVLKVGEVYDFLVLSVEREKGRVSLGFKQLQPDPFIAVMEKYNVGTDTVGKVVRLVPFGAFVELEKGIDGLVHVSESAHGYVKDINDVLKMGQEVPVRVLGIDPENKKINLSIKACLPSVTSASSEDERNNKKGKSKDSVQKQSEWKEQNTSNPFAHLLKDVDVKE
ncbi:MAG: S1 RNA-binding domain-containing protein [Clostridiales bacterium]|jgi:4-hydroxy-3-methylbut-2-enyl diphosphate reductase|nr:S1 RNA-binding domain-containing protein [Clostridiales bacterium]